MPANWNLPDSDPINKLVNAYDAVRLTEFVDLLAVLFIFHDWNESLVLCNELFVGLLPHSIASVSVLLTVSTKL